MASAELWQEYDEQGQPVDGSGITKKEAASGVWHGGAQVWIWRRLEGQVEVLLAKRGPGTKTWPGLLDVSAAGHSDAGEQPLETALRETKEELGLAYQPEDLKSFGVYRSHLVDESGIIENDFCFIYVAELSPSSSLKIDDHEVHSVQWRPFEQFRREVAKPDANGYVPHSKACFEMVLEAIETASQSKS
jgi:isopentenyldiphosphate isomerase